MEGWAHDAVFPTRVGVFPSRRCRTRTGSGLPHTRGGVSVGHGDGDRPTESSPHAWGCFRADAAVRADVEVFPTRVGVFPGNGRRVLACGCLPHTRGGVSSARFADFSAKPSSPHAWGCFRMRVLHHCPGMVFPTRVGVFPRGDRAAQVQPRLPHTRGGVSMTIADTLTRAESSPHAWGCFHR